MEEEFNWFLLQYQVCTCILFTGKCKPWDLRGDFIPQQNNLNPAPAVSFKVPSH